MDLFDVARSCARRWYIFLPLLLVAAFYSHSVYSSAKPVYYSNTVLGIAPPSNRFDQATPGSPIPRNGLLDIGGATLIANMGAVALRQPTVVAKVEEAGGLPTYVAYLMPSPGGGQLPLISIDITDADPDAVSRTLELVIAQADIALANLQQQAHVPDDQMVTTFVVSPPKAPVAGMPTRTRSTIAIFVAGFGLSVLISVLADVLLSRRRRRIGVRKARPAADRPATDDDAADTATAETITHREDTTVDGSATDDNSAPDTASHLKETPVDSR